MVEPASCIIAILGGHPMAWLCMWRERSATGSRPVSRSRRHAVVVEREDQLVVLLLLARELDAVIAPRQKRLVDQPVLSVVPLRTPAVVFDPWPTCSRASAPPPFVTAVCRAGRRDALRRQSAPSRSWRASGAARPSAQR